MNPSTRNKRRLPNRSPMRAAPASGTARKSDSSQKPAWNELAIAENHHTCSPPPAARARRPGVQDDAVREDRRHEQVPAGRAAEDRDGAAGLPAPHAPELRVRSERAPRQRLRRPEGPAEEHP